MKIIKPLEVIASNRLLYSNSINLVPVWNSAVSYSESTQSSRVLVEFNNNYYESLAPSLNQNPSTATSYWRLLGPRSDYLFGSVEWSNATTYSANTIVLYNNKYYLSLQGSNLNKQPDLFLTGTSPFWSELDPSNQTAQFDYETSTQTFGWKTLVTTVLAPKANSAAFFNLEGKRAFVTAKNYSNGESSNSWKFVTNSLGGTSVTVREAVFCESKNLFVVGYGLSDNGLGWSTDNLTTINAVTLSGMPNNLSGNKIQVSSICYSEKSDLFIAVGTVQTTTSTTPFILSSSDGKTWTRRTVPGTMTQPYKVVFATGLINRFIIVGDNGRSINSTDGINWSEAIIEASALAIFEDVQYNHTTGEVVAVGNSRMYKSSNLTTWTSVNNPSLNYKKIVIKSAGEVIVFSWTSNNIAITSFNNTLTSFTNNGTLLSGYTNHNVTGAVYCPVEKVYLISTTLPKVLRINDTITTVTDVTPTGYTNNISDLYYSPIHDVAYILGTNGTIITTNTIYHNTKTLDKTGISNWYDYFFKDFDQVTEVIFEDIPSYNSTRITLAVYGNSEVKIGVSLTGISSSIGKTQYGASAGIIDYSKKETDEFGRTTFIQRAYSKRMNVNIILPNGDLNRVQKLLTEVRAVPCVWVGTDSDIYGPLIMYGFFRDFSLEIPYPEYSYCSLQVEGLA